MEDLDSSNFDADTKGFSLIDVSVSDDDFLFSSSSTTSEANAVDNQGGSFVEEAQVGKPSNLLAAQRPKKQGKCNMRKSLAWDSAFFTSAGVLDADELSSIMEGAETGLNSNRQLPGIQEELSKSTDSITTFESDSLTLESIEADLFSDIRASIQRSSKTSNSGNENRGGSGNGCSKKIGQPPLGNMVKPRLATRVPIPAVPGPGRVLKPTTSISKQVTKPVARGRELSSTLPRSSAQTSKTSLEGTAASKRMSGSEPGHQHVPVARGRELSSTLPRSSTQTPKATLEGTTASKRMSVSASSAKSEINHAGNINGTGKETLISKGPRPVDSRKTLHKTMAPSKLSSSSSVLNKTAVRSSQSSYDSSSSSSTAATKTTTTTTKHRSQKDLGSASNNTSLSESVRDSLSDVVRRKIAKSANLPPGTKSRIPSRLPVKSKSRPGESQLSDYVKSTSELSSSISPASSVSEWSVDSSSSTATVTKKNSGLKRGSTAEVSSDSKLSPNVQKRPNVSSVDRHDLHVASVASQSAKQSPKGAAVLRTGSAKPSGLRLPSPKIGFFDGAKAAPKSPSGSARSRIDLPSKLPKSALGNHSPGPTNMAKAGSDAVKVSTSAAKTSKLDPRKIQSSPKLTKLQDRFDQSVELPSHNASDTCSEVSNASVNYSTLQRSSKVAQAANAGEHVVESEPNNDSTSLQKDSDSISSYSSDPSFELLKSTSTTSALERNTPVSGEVGSKQLGRSSPETRSDNKVDDYEGQTALKLTKQLHDYSLDVPCGNDSDPLPTSDRNNNVTEEADAGKHVTDSGSKPEIQSTGCQKESDSVIVNDNSDSCIELPDSTSATPTLEQSSEISKETDKGEHFDEASIIAKDLLEVILNASNASEVSEETDKEEHFDEASIIAKDLLEVILNASNASEVSEETDKGEHFDEASIIAKDLLEVILNASNAQSLDDELETNSKQHECPIDDSSHLNVNFMVPEQETSEENNVTVPEAVDGGKHVADIINSSALQNDTMFYDNSDYSIELAKPASTSSALDENTQASDEGQQFAEASLITKDHLEVVPKTPTVPVFDDVTSSEPLRCSSSETERNTIVAEVKDRGEYQDDLGSAYMDDKLVLKRDTNKESKSISTVSDANNHLAGMQKDPVCMIVNDDSNTSGKLPESSTNSAVEENTQVFEEAHNHSEAALVGQTFVDEIGTDSKVFISSSPEFQSDSEDAELKDREKHPDDSDSTPTDETVVLKNEACEESAKKNSPVLQKDLISIVVDEVSDISIELPNSTSTSSASERNNHVSEESNGVSNYNDGPETNLETIRCFSPETVKDTKIAEVKDSEEQPNGFCPNFNDNVILSEAASEENDVTVAKAADEGNFITDSGLNAMNNLTTTNSALDTTIEVYDEADSAEVVLVTTSVPKFDDEIESNSEQLICSSPEIGSNRKDSEVADEDEHPNPVLEIVQESDEADNGGRHSPEVRIAAKTIEGIEHAEAIEEKHAQGEMIDAADDERDVIPTVVGISFFDDVKTTGSLTHRL